MGMFMAIVVTALVTIIGGGIAYFFFMRTQPKKIAWTAYCYQLGEGVRNAKIDPRTKRPISELQLQDLRPYIKDVLVRIEEEHARTVHKLSRLNMTTNAVTADMVDLWGQEKYVHVLVHGDTATVLKKGYDQKTGNVIFQPMPRERMDLIKSEILIKKDRLKQKKDILQAITPWIVAGICILGLITITYMITDAYSDITKEQTAAEKYSADKQQEAAGLYREALSQLAREMNKVDFAEQVNQEIEEEESLGRQDPPPLESSTPQPGNMTG